MNPTPEELKTRYASYTNERLLEVLYNSADYTPAAIDAVKAELAYRKIEREDVKTFVAEQEEKAAVVEKRFQRLIVIPLTFWEKAMYYFLWFGGSLIGGAFQSNYAEDNLLLKLKQSKVFKFAGFIGLLLTGFISFFFELESVYGWVVYIGLFFAFCEVEKRFFAYEIK